MRRPAEAPSTEQLRRLRAVVKAIAERRKIAEPFAYVWLAAQVLGREREPGALTADECERLIAWRLDPGAS